jgi:putative hydrolase of the HAD superfamily
MVSAKEAGPSRLEPYIDPLVVSGDIGHQKPDPRIFQHALGLVGVAPHEAVFVGDRLDVDVAGAKAAGMRAIWFNHWGGELPAHGPTPDDIIHQFDELLPLLQKTAHQDMGSMPSFGASDERRHR